MLGFLNKFLDVNQKEVKKLEDLISQVDKFSTEAKRIKKDAEKKTDDRAIERLTEKTKSTIMDASIRVLVSAESKERADIILADIESAFNQFSEPDSNSFTFTHAKDSKLDQLAHEFSFRLQNKEANMPLNFK